MGPKNIFFIIFSQKFSCFFCCFFPYFIAQPNKIIMLFFNILIIAISLRSSYSHVVHQKPDDVSYHQMNADTVQNQDDDDNRGHHQRSLADDDLIEDDLLKLTPKVNPDSINGAEIQQKALAGDELVDNILADGDDQFMDESGNRLMDFSF